MALPLLTIYFTLILLPIQGLQHERSLAVAVRDSTGGLAHIQLTNLTAVPVVAWTLRIVGADGHIWHTTQDNYIHLALDPIGPRVLMPGRPTLVALREAWQLNGATIVPIAVIYADRTAAGDEDRIRSIFAARQADVAMWTELLPQLVPLEQSADPKPIMARVAADIRDPTGTKGGRAWRHSVSESLTRISTSPNPSANIRALMAELRRFESAARFHAVRP